MMEPMPQEEQSPMKSVTITDAGNGMYTVSEGGQSPIMEGQTEGGEAPMDMNTAMMKAKSMLMSTPEGMMETQEQQSGFDSVAAA